MANKPFKNVVMNLLAETGSSRKARAKLSQMYSGDDLQAAIDTLNSLTAQDEANRRSRTAGSVAGAPKTVLGVK